MIVSKYYKDIIRKTRWFHTEVKLINTNDINDKIKYLTTNFNFMKYDLSDCYITDESVKLLTHPTDVPLTSMMSIGNCHTLNLYRCKKITDESVKLLKSKGVNII